MSGAQFRKSWKSKFYKRIQTGTPIVFSERLSHLDSTTSNNPLLITKFDQNSEENKKISDRIVKAVDISTGGGIENVECDVENDCVKSIVL